jgi:hypothetical protein
MKLGQIKPSGFIMTQPRYIIGCTKKERDGIASCHYIHYPQFVYAPKHPECYFSNQIKRVTLMPSTWTTQSLSNTRLRQ